MVIKRHGGNSFLGPRLIGDKKECGMRVGEKIIRWIYVCMRGEGREKGNQNNSYERTDGVLEWKRCARSMYVRKEKSNQTRLIEPDQVAPARVKNENALEAASSGVSPRGCILGFW
jgi:hypothetical protein